MAIQISENKTSTKQSNGYKDNDYSLDAIKWRQQQYDNRYNETLNAVNKRESDYLDSLKNNNKPVTGGSQGVKFVNGRKITVDNTENINNNYMRTSDGIVRKQSTAPQQKSYSEMSVEELNAELSKAKAQTEQAKKDYNYELSRSAFPLVGLFTEEAKAKKQMQKEAESKENEIKNALFKANQKSTFDSLSDESKEALAVYYDSVSKDTPLTVTPQYAKQQVLDAFKKQGIATDDDTFASIYEYYKFDADEKRAQRKQAETEKKYNNASTLGKVGMNAKTVATSPIRGLSALTQMIEAGTRGYRDENAPLNINDDSFDLLNYSDTVRGNTQKDIASATNNNIVADALYSAAMSAGDMASNALLSGGMGSAVTSSMLGVNAATSSAKEATQRGISKDKAIATGITSGLIETATEKIPLDNLYGIVKTSGTGVKAALKSVLKQAGIEATEEAISELANTLADGIINGADSQYEQSVKAYMNAGVTEEEAKKYATNDVVKNIGKSALAGGISGGVLGGGAQVLSYGMNGRYNSLNPLEDSSNNNQVNTNADTQKGSMTDGGVQARAVTSETESDSTSFDNNIPTLQNNVNESVNVKEKTAFQDHVDNVNKLDSNKKPMTDIEIEQTKADLFKVTNDIKRDLRNTTNMYYKGENRKEIVSAIEKMIDDYAENPTDANFETLINAIGLVDGAMHGQKYTRKKSGVTTVYDNELSVLFNHNADSFVDNAYKLNGRNIADNVAGNPTLTAEFTPQQTTQNELNPLENGNNTSVQKVSKTRTNTAEKSGFFTEEQGKKYMPERDFVYETVSDRKSIEQAADFIEQNGSNAWSILESRESFNGVDMDSAMSLWSSKVKEAQALEVEGLDATAVWQEANTMFKKIREQGTKNGQAIQALAKWSRNTPEGIIAQTATNVETEIRKIVKNDKAAQERIDSIWDKVSSDVAKYAKQAYDAGIYTREGKEAFAQIGKTLDANMPKTFLGTIKTLLMNNMLGNFRTLVSRNALGNVFYNVGEFARQPITAGIDMLVSQKTGVRTRNGINTNKIVSAITGAKDGLLAEFKDFKNGIHTTKSGFDSVKDVYDINRHGFQGSNLITKVINKCDDLVKHGLSIGDRPFYEAAYAQRMTELRQLRKDNMLGEAVSKMSDNDFEQFASLAAKLDGLTATYQDSTKIAKAFNDFKKAIAEASEGIVGSDVMSQFTMAFTNTPGNIITRGLEYNPFGIVKNAVTTGKEIFIDKNFNQQRFVDETGRNIIGSGLFIAGLVAVANGLITGGYSEDKDMKNAQKNAGMQEYALNTGNANVSIDWIPVVGNNLVAASAFQEAYDKDGGNGLTAIGAGTSAGLNALFNTSSLQAMNRLFGGNTAYGSENNIIDNAIASFQSGLGQFVPSLARQVGQVADEYQRDVSSGDNPYWKNSIINQIPFVRETLQPKVDNEGNLMKQNQGRSIASKIFENMLSPAYYTELSDSVVNNEAMRLYESTGEKGQFLPTASRTNDFKNVDVEMTDEMFTEYKQEFGKNNSKVATAVIQSDFYNALSDEQKVKALSDVYEGMKAYTKNKLYQKETDNKIAEMYEQGGTDAVIEYMDYKNVLGKNNMSDTDKMRTIWNEKGKEGLETWNDLREMSKDDDGNIDTELLYSNLANSDMSEEDKGYYLLNNINRTDKIDSIVNELGNAGIYRYYEYKRSADKNGNGSLTVKDELVPFLNSQPMSNGERAYWFDLMKSSKKTKNPYGQAQIPYLH